jgi:hypothetical protein
MSTKSKVCKECGVPLDIGLSHCRSCGTQTGTLFSEGVEQAPLKSNKRQRIAEHVSTHSQIERAHERANNSMVLALSSFLPLLGLVMAWVAIFFGVESHRTLRAHNIEEGRGTATAGVLIGVMAILAQVSYVVWAWKEGLNKLFGD